MSHDVLLSHSALLRNRFHDPHRARGTGFGTRGAGVNFGVLRSTHALLLLGETYLKMHRYREARVAFQVILDNYSSSALVIAARRYLDLMKTRGV